MVKIVWQPMQYLHDNFLKTVREKLGPDFYPNETNYDALGGNTSNRFLIARLSFCFLHVTVWSYA